MRLKPRYHFSGNQNLFFERTPYRNHRVLKEKEKHLTRFLGLAKVNKSNKPKVIYNTLIDITDIKYIYSRFGFKYLYAFNITPSKNLEYREVIKNAAAGLATDNPYSDRLEFSRLFKVCICI